jgi:Ca-activated chloride channel family protein
MKLGSLSMWAAAAMIATAGVTYFVVPDGGASASPPAGVASTDLADPSAAPSTLRALVAGTETSPARFRGGSTVVVDARLGNAAAARGRNGDTFLLVEARGGDAAATTSPPVHLGLVIDRSGSMRGQRIKNAISAALSAIDRLNDGDSVSVVAFDTQAITIAPPTILDARTRDDVKTRVSGIQLGGDTCISCGMDAEMALADRTSGRTEHMIVLSDGDTNNGIRDEGGLRKLAESARERGITVTSIGVDLQFNERVMAAIAEGGDGRHYFVQRPEDLGAVFESEAAALKGTVADRAEATFDLAPGVELVEVRDRTFTRQGSRITVPIGSLSRGEVKTVLLHLRTPAPASDVNQIAHVGLAFGDLTTGQPGRVDGDLAEMAAADADPVDPFVDIRVEKSKTADTLEHANELFRRGDLAGAQAAIDAQKKKVEAFEVANDHAANDPFGGRGGDAVADSRTQLDKLDKAGGGFATPPPPKPGAPRPVIAADDPFASRPEAQVKGNQAAAADERR